jgi:hypothetical protein
MSSPGHRGIPGAMQFLLECCWSHFDVVERSGFWDQDLCERIKKPLEEKNRMGKEMD